MQIPPQICANHVFARAVQKLFVSKELTIGYLGGSLTDGSGASDPNEGSWRAQTTEWFRGRFPDAAISEVNGAIGGTGSEFGLYRITEDLLQTCPDVVFVEFSVNDRGMSEGERNRVSPAIEGIVLRIWDANPQATIVFVYTTMKSLEPYHVAQELSPAAKLDEIVAQHYGIASVNIGTAIWDYLQSEGLDWNDILPDNVHPNDEGYAVYSEAMRVYLEAQDWSVHSDAPVNLPERLYPKLPLQAQQIRAAAYANDDWQVVEQVIEGRHDHLFCETPGKDLRFQFEGDAIGLVWISADDAGVIEYSIDGAPFVTHSSWTPHGGDHGRLYGPIFHNPLLDTELVYGPHEIVIRVAAEQDERSDANRVRIVAFIVNGTSISERTF